MLSAGALGWNVYRDVVQRPRFRVSVAVKSIYMAGHEPIGPDLYVEALNLGPIPNRIGLVGARPNWFDRNIRRKPSAQIMHDHTHMGHSANSQRVEVGDTATFVFPIDSEFVKEPEFAQVGVSDGYGRMHWAPARNTRSALAQARERLAKDVATPGAAPAA